MSGLNSLFDDFDLSAPSSKKGASMNSMKQGGCPAHRPRAPPRAREPRPEEGRGTRSRIFLASEPPRTSPTRAIPTGNVPSATPGAPPASDFFASPRVMGAAPGATPARPSADPFGGLGAGDGLFGSLGGGAPRRRDAHGRHEPIQRETAAGDDIAGER